jgi:hypothetical protein
MSLMLWPVATQAPRTRRERDFLAPVERQETDRHAAAANQNTH